MKSVWRGELGFGLVNIPVKLYSAIQQKNLELEMLDRRDMAKIRFLRVNELTGEVVGNENIGRAYNLDGRYILLDNADFEAASPGKTGVIELTRFISEKEIDSIYYDKSWYVEPEIEGEQAYALLREALRKSRKAGLGTFTFRNSSSVTLLKPWGDLLLLTRIRYPEEIRGMGELNHPAGLPSDRNEMKLALDLIRRLSVPFNIGDYSDESAILLLERIMAKAAGKKARKTVIKPATAPPGTLAEQLRYSLTSMNAA